MNPDFQYGQPTPPAQPQPLPQPTQLQYQQPQAAQAPQYYATPGQPQQSQPGYAPIPPVNNFVSPPKPTKKWFILALIFIFLTLAALGLGTWALYNYLDQKNNVDAKVSTAVATAVKNTADKDAEDFKLKEQQPNRLFTGPDDYGRLAFDYPKTWSIYVAKEASNNDAYEAYFNPVSVPPIDDDTQYALRVTIEQRSIEDVLGDYGDLVEKGDLKSSAVKADSTDGTRLDGSFTENIRGSAVIFKIRDKTVTLRTDAETFKDNFDALVQTITFNK